MRDDDDDDDDDDDECHITESALDGEGQEADSDRFPMGASWDKERYGWGRVCVFGGGG